MGIVVFSLDGSGGRARQQGHEQDAAVHCVPRTLPGRLAADCSDRIQKTRRSVAGNGSWLEGMLTWQPLVSLPELACQQGPHGVSKKLRPPPPIHMFPGAHAPWT